MYCHQLHNGRIVLSSDSINPSKVLGFHFTLTWPSCNWKIEGSWWSVVFTTEVHCATTTTTTNGAGTLKRNLKCSFYANELNKSWNDQWIHWKHHVMKNCCHKYIIIKSCLFLKISFVGKSSQTERFIKILNFPKKQFDQ